METTGNATLYIADHVEGREEWKEAMDFLRGHEVSTNSCYSHNTLQPNDLTILFYRRRRRQVSQV